MDGGMRRGLAPLAILTLRLFLRRCIGWTWRCLFGLRPGRSGRLFLRRQTRWLRRTQRIAEPAVGETGRLPEGRRLPGPRRSAGRGRATRRTFRERGKRLAQRVHEDRSAFVERVVALDLNATHILSTRTIFCFGSGDGCGRFHVTGIAHGTPIPTCIRTPKQWIAAQFVVHLTCPSLGVRE